MTRQQRRLARQRRKRRRALAVVSALASVVALVAVGVIPLPTGGAVRPVRAKAPGTTTGKASPVVKVLPAAATFATNVGVGASWVVAENRRPGSSAWQITGAQAPGGIMGYADRVQARLGQTVTLRVSTKAASFHVDAYRMGYYQGQGARLMWRSGEVPGADQPLCPVTPGINMVTCHWAASLSFTVTPQWVQGQYLLKLIGAAGQQSYVPLTIWDPASHATYVVMSGVLTDQAFNPFGGYDLYQGLRPCAPNHYPCSSRSRVVSFDRPYSNGDGAASYLSLAYPLTRFAEQHGLDVTYWTDITLATHGNLLRAHKVLISPGHDEEWSLQMRQAAVAAAGGGVNLIFFGASPILRKVRLEPSPLGPDRQMVNYRNPMADPLYGVNNAEVTQNWWGQPPADLPARTLVGASYVGFDPTGSSPLVVSDPSSWLFAGAGLGAGATVAGVFTGDYQAYNPAPGASPPGVEILAHSPVRIAGHPERSYADTTYYTMATSGAGVFSSGTIGWIPSMQGCAPAAPSCPARIMGILTGNLLRVFGAGPVGLTHPSAANWQLFYR